VAARGLSGLNFSESPSCKNPNTPQCYVLHVFPIMLHTQDRLSRHGVQGTKPKPYLSYHNQTLAPKICKDNSLCYPVILKKCAARFYMQKGKKL